MEEGGPLNTVRHIYWLVLARLLILFFELFNMCQQLIFVSHAAKVKAEHLKSSFGWPASGPQADKQTGNDG